MARNRERRVLAAAKSALGAEFARCAEIADNAGKITRLSVSFPCWRRSSPRNPLSISRVCFQTILLGDSGVGKTSLLVQFDTGRFQPGNFAATVGIGFTVSNILTPTCSSFPTRWCHATERGSSMLSPQSQSEALSSALLTLIFVRFCEPISPYPSSWPLAISYIYVAIYRVVIIFDHLFRFRLRFFS